MRISDWSSDVCSSDLPEIASTQSLRLDEAELLLVMALERLDLANDRAAAERAYVLAEAIFSDVANPRFVSLKQTLAQELRRCVRRPRTRVSVHWPNRSEGHTSEIQSKMRISYAVLRLEKKT